MIEDLIKLEKKAAQLEPDSNTRDELMHKVWDYAAEYLNELKNDRAFKGKPKQKHTIERFEISESPDTMKSTLSDFDNNVMQSGINGAHGGHLGYVPGGGLFPSALGDLLAAITNRYAGIFYASPGAANMEHSLVDWMGDLFGLPEATRGGTLTSGGSIANLTAVTTARDSKGVSAAHFQDLCIYCTLQTHHCVDKALKIAGLADAKLRRIPMDSSYRMDAVELEKQIKEDKQQNLIPLMIIGTAGTTDMGVMDPLNELAQIAQQHSIWFHVDAAYGGFFNLVEDLKPKFSGIEKADSIVVDPHKSLFLPFGTGALLVREKQKLYESQHLVADYMQDSQEPGFNLSPADLSPELTRHYRGLRMWLPLKLFGVKAFRNALKEKHLLSRYAWQQLQTIDNIETGPQPDLSILFFRYLPERGNTDQFNQQLIKKIQDDGQIFLSSTRIEGRFYIRIAVLSFRTHLSEVNKAIERIKTFCHELD